MTFAISAPRASTPDQAIWARNILQIDELLVPSWNSDACETLHQEIALSQARHCQKPGRRQALQQSPLESDLDHLVARFNQGAEVTTRVPSEYVETMVTRS